MWYWSVVFVQKVAGLHLKKLGCKVDVAANGQEAVEMVKSIRYDILFMDCQMPGTKIRRNFKITSLQWWMVLIEYFCTKTKFSNWKIFVLTKFLGYVAATTIREQHDHDSFRIPIIALTANAMKGEREKCLTSGMDGYITKVIFFSFFLHFLSLIHLLSTWKNSDKFF